MQLVNPLAEQYAEKYTSNDDALLKRVYDETLKQHLHAHMISGLVQGQFLSMLSALVQPMFILEIGSFTGFSALCLAKGLQPGGQLHTIELREVDAETSRKNFALSPKNNQIHLLLRASGLPDLLYQACPIFGILFLLMLIKLVTLTTTNWLCRD